MRKISIKTVDGNRYDFVKDVEDWPFKMDTLSLDWIKIEDNGVVRMFFRSNIVTITVKEIGDE